MTYHKIAGGITLFVMKTILKLNSDTLKFVNITLRNPHHVEIHEGVTVIIGPNGAGKSKLGRIIEQGWNFATNSIKWDESKGKPDITFVEFNDIHSLSGSHIEYYQQRYEATMNDEVPVVRDIFADKIGQHRWHELAERLDLHGIEEKKINFLSSGELRKVLIVSTLMDNPDVLIIDNPYIGLDAPSRELFSEMLASMGDQGVSLILLVSDPADIPAFADEVIPLRDGEIGKPIDLHATPSDELAQAMDALMEWPFDISLMPDTLHRHEGHDVTMQMRDCLVRYGNREILRNLNWTIRQGECWALCGPNGSGKSVLLSLVNADNPQAYANDITLFDHKRGTGESIWDIKERIGYVSPEQHLHFHHSGTVTDVIEQEIRNLRGNYGRISPEMAEEARQWMRLFRIEHLASRRYDTLSQGEQRLTLIIRTIIKHPDLLIFDEPLHGLDASRKRAVRRVIDTIARRENPSIIFVTHCLEERPECVTNIKTIERTL